MATRLKVTKKRQAGETPPKLSEWIALVNSNVHVADLTKAQAKEWKAQIKAMWADTYTLLQVPPKDAALGVGPLRHPPKRLISDIEVEIAFEVGPTTGFLHAHIHVAVRHTTKVQLNYRLINQALAEIVTGDGKEHKQYFTASMVRDHSQIRIASYFGKPDAEIEKVDQA